MKETNTNSESKAKDSQARKYLLTFNNPLEKELTHTVLCSTIEDNFKSVVYYCIADEVGAKDHTHHTHLYLHFSSSVRFSTIKNQFPTAHIDKSRGTAEQNRDYVFKQNKWADTAKSETNLHETHFEWGELPEERQGFRTDLSELYEQIKNGATNSEILDDNPDNMKYLTAIDRTRKIVLEERYRTVWRDLEVTYIFGQTGVGKTRYIMEQYGYENVYRVTDYKNPYDSYNCQEVVLFDEYSSDIKIQEMLNVLDGYPLELRCRYANKQACFTKIFIISNVPLQKQYENIRLESPAILEAFYRRITRVLEFTSDGLCQEYIKYGNKYLIEIVKSNDPPYIINELDEHKPLFKG